MRAILIDSEFDTLSVTEIELDARPGRVIDAVEAAIAAAAGTPASLRWGHDLRYTDLFLAAAPGASSFTVTCRSLTPASA